MVIMLGNGINCIKFYWFGIFCSAIICIVVSTFLDYRVLFSKGDFYTWRVSFTIFVVSFTVSDIIMLQVTALSRFLYLRIRYSIKCPLCIFPFLINSVDGKLEVKIGKKPEVVYCDFIDDEEYNRFSYEEMIRILREGIIARKIGRYIFGISVMILFLCFKPAGALIVIILLAEFEALDMIYERKFHGDNFKLRNIRRGNGALYLNKVYDGCRVENFYDDDINKNYVLGMVKRRLAKNIYDNDYTEPAYVNNILKSLFMEPEEISTSPDIKELDIVTLYVFYAIFSKNEDYVGNIRNVVLRMKLYVGQYSKLWRDYFDYFLQIIDSYQWKKELEINKKKDMILLYDCWANIPGRYRNTLLYVKNKIDDYINQI
jgi:hypothetical protein